jgi:hypothetical protein
MADDGEGSGHENRMVASSRYVWHPVANVFAEIALRITHHEFLARSALFLSERRAVAKRR